VSTSVPHPGKKGESVVTLKAAYTADMLYMLIQYKDPTNSIRRMPYQKQADGSWKKLGDPNDKGGDDNLYYEDKWAMLWPPTKPPPNRLTKKAVPCRAMKAKANPTATSTPICQVRFWICGT
jgi:hypothetical protein